MKTRKVAILGSTGSIGCQGLEVIDEFEHLEAAALAAGSNWRLMAEQLRHCGAKFAAMSDIEAAKQLKSAISDNSVKIFSGPDCMTELLECCGADIVLSGVVGSCGLAAALKTIELGMDLAIANKETLVMAGQLVTDAAAAKGVKLLPVDSEHSAIYQCLVGSSIEDVDRIIITASGGALRDWPVEKMATATVQDALAHPTWSMGRKITIDSATLMNKALEIIEAHWLFGLPAEKIHAVIHPESIIHSVVEFSDGSQLAQLGWPSMTTPIAYALNHPHRLHRRCKRLDLFEAKKLTFMEIDSEKFPAVSLAYRVITQGRGAGAVVNAANEAAVKAFLDGKIPFGKIVTLVEDTLNRHDGSDENSLDALLAADKWARDQVKKQCF